MKAKLKVLYKCEGGGSNRVNSYYPYVELRKWNCRMDEDYVLEIWVEQDNTEKVLLDVIDDADAIRQAVKKHEDLMLKEEEE